MNYKLVLENQIEELVKWQKSLNLDQANEMCEISKQIMELIAFLMCNY